MNKLFLNYIVFPVFYRAIYFVWLFMLQIPTLLFYLTAGVKMLVTKLLIPIISNVSIFSQTVYEMIFFNTPAQSNSIEEVIQTFKNFFTTLQQVPAPPPIVTLASAPAWWVLAGAVISICGIVMYYTGALSKVKTWVTNKFKPNYAKKFADAGIEPPQGSDFNCPISLVVKDDPVLLNNHGFDRSYLLQVRPDKDGVRLDPLDPSFIFTEQEIKTDWALRARMDRVLRLGKLPASEYPQDPALEAQQRDQIQALEKTQKQLQEGAAPAPLEVIPLAGPKNTIATPLAENSLVPQRQPQRQQQLSLSINPRPPIPGPLTFSFPLRINPNPVNVIPNEEEARASGRATAANNYVSFEIARLMGLPSRENLLNRMLAPSQSSSALRGRAAKK